MLRTSILVCGLLLMAGSVSAAEVTYVLETPGVT